jgi:hypothetical protein
MPAQRAPAAQPSHAEIPAGATGYQDPAAIGEAAAQHQAERPPAVAGHAAGHRGLAPAPDGRTDLLRGSWPSLTLAAPNLAEPIPWR